RPAHAGGADHCTDCPPRDLVAHPLHGSTRGLHRVRSPAGSPVSAHVGRRGTGQSPLSLGYTMGLPIPPPFHDAQTGALADLLDWGALLGTSPTVLGTKTGRLQTTLRYTCPDTAHLHPVERTSYLARLHAVLGALTEEWALDADWWHEEAP